jgi:hypothetical protein
VGQNVRLGVMSDSMYNHVMLIWRISPGIKAISCCARTVIFAVNSRNIVFFYIFFLCSWVIIS